LERAKPPFQLFDLAVGSDMRIIGQRGTTRGEREFDHGDDLATLVGDE
jgi:hypothetical protein